MIERWGNLFACTDWDAICLTTNGSVTRGGRGVMGRGVALQATQLFEHVALYLGQHLRKNGNHVGVLIEQDPSRILGPAIVCFPVKDEWAHRARPDLIVQSCQELVDLTNQRGWTKVALPRPGCGNGGLTWERVKPLIEPWLNDRFSIVELPKNRYIAGRT